LLFYFQQYQTIKQNSFKNVEYKSQAFKSIEN
jgi:hypothetical protein